MVNKFWNIVKIILALSSGVAIVSFICDRMEEIRYKQCIKHKSKCFYERFIKRPLDAFLSTGALIVFSPILLITAVLVRIKLGRPVIFSQERPGIINPLTKELKIFKLYKFRSMTNEKDKNGKLLSDDIRLTSFGKKLRSTSIDELPELFNIIKGDMAIIGPRPLLTDYIPFYTEAENHRHDVRPGLTGLAQVNGRNAINSWEERFRYDIEYVNNITFLMDLKIILKTIVKVIKKSDIQVGSEIKVGRLDEARSENINKEI